MQLRDYQTEAVYSIFRYFEKYKADSGNPLVLLPTGTGKSLVIAGFLKLLFQWYSGQRVMMLTHVKELIEQNYEKLMLHWPEAPAGIYSAGLKRKEAFNMITFAGIQSVAKKAALFGNISIILIDEAHLLSPSEKTTYQKFIKALKEVNPYLKVVGLTATGYRLGQGMLTEEGGLFTDIAIDLTTTEAFNWFIQEGYLLPPVPKKTRFEYDISSVGMSGGELKIGELADAVNKDRLTQRALEEAMERGADRYSWLIFCSGVDHTNSVAAMLTDMGIECGAVHSKISDEERDTILSRFKRGELRAVANNNVLTTGFDHPACDLLVILRPTTSPGLWVQILGRGTRPCYAAGFDLSTTEGRLQAIGASHKQNCLVLDFGGNTRRLGQINDPVVPKAKGKGKGEAPVKDCPYCGSYNHASVRYCGGLPKLDVTGYTEEQFREIAKVGYTVNGLNASRLGYCGAEFVFQSKLKAVASEEALVKEDVPIEEVYKVDAITYTPHFKKDKPPSMKVTYYCGHKQYTDYVCIEHEDYARRKALNWWINRTTIPFPASVDEALEVTHELKNPTHLRIWINRKWPEITAYCYDGSAFGKEPPQQVHIHSSTIRGDGTQVGVEQQPGNFSFVAASSPKGFQDNVAHQSNSRIEMALANLPDPDVPF